MSARMTGAVLFSLSLAACYNWTPPRSPDPQTIIAASGAVRFTMTDGRKLELYDPRVTGDTVIGWDLWAREVQGRSVKVCLPREQIRLIEERATSPAKTTALVLGVGLSAGVLALLVAMSNWSPLSVCGGGC